MNLAYKERLDYVASLFNNDDIDLGYRILMDCVTETQNMDYFKSTITLTDWKHSKAYTSKAFKEKSLKILNALYDADVKIYESSSPVINCKDVIKTYGTNGFKLGPISLDIKKGEIFGLVGENGNGKTTLLRILAKELNYNSGILNYSLDKGYTSDFDLRTRLIYIPQRTEKWFGSLLDNLKFVPSNYKCAPEENHTRVLMMIARFGLWNYKHLKWSELSSGYKMRFELARTMLRQPELLLLDEPLANLDVLAQQLILEDLKSMCASTSKPIALILSSQQLYEVEKVSDRVIFLKQGVYNDNTSLFTEQESLAIEIEANCEKKELLNAFKELALQELAFNGGLYIAKFDTDTSFNSVLLALSKTDITIVYLRNITNSTRRFFVS